MNQSTKDKHRWFRRFSLITLIAVYLLILVGGIVRSTGSGMGCPDWPKCFGQYVPPTTEEELPVDYKDIYASKRARKNERFAKYLVALGFTDKAQQLLTDESILVEADFNVYRTWTEYLNRLVGALVGFFVLITFATSFTYIKEKKRLFFISLFTLLLVIFQGWIGSIVVSTNLLPWMVTVHMFLAIVIIALLIYLVFEVDKRFQSEHKRTSGSVKINLVLIASIVLLLLQVLFGTHVREALDVVISAMGTKARGVWIDSLGGEFELHRSFSWLVLLVNGYLAYLINSHFKTEKLVRGLGNIILGFIIVSIFSGVIMAYFAVPAFAQPVHLLFAISIFGAQFLLLLNLHKGRKAQLENITVEE